MDISGITQISDEGIKKHFKNIEPWQALFELAWNGFDANASSIDISIKLNDLGAVDVISVLDNGDGIDFENIAENFGKFNDSTKKEDATQHGLHGRGRLSFHRISHKAKWFTKSQKGQAKISIDSSNVKNYSASIEKEEPHQALAQTLSGTYVELTNIYGTLPKLDDLHNHCAVEFGWYLALNKTKALRINNKEVHIPSHEITDATLTVGNYDFTIKIIRWDERPSSEKSYIYLLDKSDKVVYKQLSSFNNKLNFHTSIYVQSTWANNFSVKQDLLSQSSVSIDSDEWVQTLKFTAETLQKVYDDFLRRFVDTEIEKYESDGVFPTYPDEDKNYAEWKRGNIKALVKTIYTADPTVFSSLNKKQKKIIVRLLDKISISNENDSLFEVLNSVLDLDKKNLDSFANQLKCTQLENIISTIEILKQRQFAVEQLRELMNEHYKDVLETPDLQKIIEHNTWLFGNRYETLGAEEDTFTKISHNLRNQIKNISVIEEDDIAEEVTISGAKKQTDLFLARKIPAFDSFGNKIYRCIVIEIKRPSISLNIKHLRQLDDYAGIIKKHPEFNSEHMHFELILIGRKISNEDTEIRSRMKNQLSRGEMGLVTDDERMKRYVLNWYTLLDGFQLSHDFLLEQLTLRRDNLSPSKSELLHNLQTA